MSSRRGSGNPSPAGANPSHKGKTVQHSAGGFNGDGRGTNVNQLSQNVADLSLGSAEAGQWEVFSKKSKSRAGAAKPLGPPNSVPKAWGSDTMQKLGPPGNGGTGKTSGSAWQSQVDTKRNVGRGNVKSQQPNSSWEAPYMAPPVPTHAIPPPLQHGWNWAGRVGSSQPQIGGVQGRGNGGINPQAYATGEHLGSDGGDSDGQNDSDDDDDAALAEDTDDDILSDGFDSDESVKSHETRKQNRWFKAFFGALDSLTVDLLNETSRQWHCPACAGGPGAINWYRGLQPLMAHAKTKGATRVRLHREFAELLDTELFKRGTSVIPSGEVFGKWAGLRETVTDHEIVWPPMVMVLNTQLEQDDNEKWLGMGNQELLDYFSAYKAVKARHSYGPTGHRGISLLIFESSAMGYNEAERLHKHFATQGTDRDAWQHRRVLFYPGGKRQLYGYMARKDDMDSFNQHCQGKTRLKFELRSYQEMVVQPLRQMEEDSQRVSYLTNKLEREKKVSETLNKNFRTVSEMLRKTREENKVVRAKTKKQYEQNKEEMDNQDSFYNEQISALQQALEEREKDFEELLQAERNKKVKESSAHSRSTEESKLRLEEVDKFIKKQDKGLEEFEAEREELIKLHDDEKAELRKKHIEEEVELEKKFTTSLIGLMAKYEPKPSEEGGFPQ